MFNIDIINSFLKMLIISIFIFYVFFKMINYKEISRSKKLTILLLSTFLAIGYIILKINFNIIVRNILYFIFFCFIISKITNREVSNAVIPLIMSVSIVVTIFIFSAIIGSTLLKIFLHNMEKNNPTVIAVIAIIEGFLLYCIFKIKRFKNRIFVLSKETLC